MEKEKRFWGVRKERITKNKAKGVNPVDSIAPPPKPPNRHSYNSTCPASKTRHHIIVFNIPKLSIQGQTKALGKRALGVQIYKHIRKLETWPLLSV